MTVELAKIVDESVRQRACYTITALPDGWTHVEVILHRDEEPGDRVLSGLFLCYDDAAAHIYRTFVGHFGKFSEPELHCGALSWSIAAYDSTPQHSRELAESIASALCDRLAEESGDSVYLAERSERITWCPPDTKLNEFTHQMSD